MAYINGVMVIYSSKNIVGKFTIRHDTRCYFNVRSKADMSQIKLQHETTTNSGEQEDKKVKTDMLRSIGKQSGESVESVRKKKT